MKEGSSDGRTDPTPGLQFDVMMEKQSGRLKKERMMDRELSAELS